MFDRDVILVAESDDGGHKTSFHRVSTPHRFAYKGELLVIYADKRLDRAAISGTDIIYDLERFLNRVGPEKPLSDYSDYNYPPVIR